MVTNASVLAGLIDPSKEAENSLTVLNGLERNSIESYDNNSDLTMI